MPARPSKPKTTPAPEPVAEEVVTPAVATDLDEDADEEEILTPDLIELPEPAAAEIAAVAKEEAVAEEELERVIERTLHMDGMSVDDPVRLYLREIGKTALLKADQEAELARRMEAGREANTKLMALGINSPVPDWADSASSSTVHVSTFGRGAAPTPAV